MSNMVDDPTFMATCLSHGDAWQTIRLRHRNTQMTFFSLSNLSAMPMRQRDLPHHPNLISFNPAP